MKHSKQICIVILIILNVTILLLLSSNEVYFLSTAKFDGSLEAVQSLKREVISCLDMDNGCNRDYRNVRKAQSCVNL